MQQKVISSQRGEVLILPRQEAKFEEGFLSLKIPGRNREDTIKSLKALGLTDAEINGIIQRNISPAWVKEKLVVFGWLTNHPDYNILPVLLFLQKQENLITLPFEPEKANLFLSQYRRLVALIKDQKEPWQDTDLTIIYLIEKLGAVFPADITYLHKEGYDLKKELLNGIVINHITIERNYKLKTYNLYELSCLSRLGLSREEICLADYYGMNAYALIQIIIDFGWFDRANAVSPFKSIGDNILDGNDPILLLIFYARRSCRLIFDHIKTDLPEEEAKALLSRLFPQPNEQEQQSA